MSVDKKEVAEEEPVRQNSVSPATSETHTVQDIGADGTHYFHSPLNSNAVITINGLGVGPQTPLSLELLTTRYLILYTNFEIVTNDLNSIKIKFINKTDAQSLEALLAKEHPQVSIKIDYDTLTHPGNIYVRGLVPEVTTQDLHEIFEPFGEVTSCKIVTDEFGQSKGYGFVNFLKGSSADDAISKLNGLLINGSKLYLNHHIAKKERAERLSFEKQNFTNLYVKNMPSSFEEAQVRELFGKFGDVHSVFLPESGHSDKRFGFVNYKKHESAIEAILNLDHKELEPDLFLSVSRAQRKDERRSSSSVSPPLAVPVPMIPTLGPVSLTPQPISPVSVSQPRQVNNINQNLSQEILTTPTVPPLINIPLPGPHQQQSNLYVKNLTQAIDDKALHDIFRKFGSIISAKIMTLEDGITSRGFGFVCFKTVQEASRALLATNGASIDGEVIHVSFAQKNNKRLQNKQNQIFTYRPPINNSNYIPMYYGQQQQQQQQQQQLPTPHNDQFYYQSGYNPNFNRNNFNNFNNYNNRNGYKKRSTSVPSNLYSELNQKLSQLETDDAKFNTLLEDLIEPKFKEFKKDPSLKEIELHESSKTALLRLIEQYEEQEGDVYLDLVNDISNGDSKLVQAFEQLKV